MSPEKDYHSLSPNFHIHVSGMRFTYSHDRTDRTAYSAAGKYMDWSWEYIYRSETHECGNWDWSRAIPFLGIHKWDWFSLQCRIERLWLPPLPTWSFSHWGWTRSVLCPMYVVLHPVHIVLRPMYVVLHPVHVILRLLLRHDLRHELRPPEVQVLFLRLWFLQVDLPVCILLLNKDAGLKGLSHESNKNGMNNIRIICFGAV